MPAESAADRLSMLEAFGTTVRVTLPTGPVDLVGIVDAPTSEVSGVIDEIDVLEASQSVLLRTEDIPGLEIGADVDVLSGPLSGSYVATRVVAEDDGAFTRLDLGT